MKIYQGVGWREFILYHFSVPNHKHRDTQQFILTQCFHIFLLFSIGGAKKTKNRAKLSIGLDTNMEVLLQHGRYLIFALCCGLHLNFKYGILTLVFSIERENPGSPQYISCSLCPICWGRKAAGHTVVRSACAESY